MKLQEADAKSLLVAQGLPVPPWEVAHTVAEARAAAEQFLSEGADKVVIKAQVLIGGRGKAGGVEDAGRRLRQLRPDAVAGDQGDSVGHAAILATRRAGRRPARPAGRTGRA